MKRTTAELRERVKIILTNIQKSGRTDLIGPEEVSKISRHDLEYIDSNYSQFLEE